MRITKRAITLLEIMIVIFIIGIIGSVIGYNMKGSLDEGRAFKSEQGSKLVYDVLTLELAKGDLKKEEILTDPKPVLTGSGFVGNANKVFKDGWGEEYEIHKVVGTEEFIIYSKKWESFLKNKKKMDDEKMVEEYPWAFSLSPHEKQE